MLSDLLFRRKFSAAFYKNLRLRFARFEMSKDFLCKDRGDKYPCVLRNGEVSEKTENGRYYFSSEKGELCRIFGELLPYSNVEITLEDLSGQIGLCVYDGEKAVPFITLSNPVNLTVKTDCESFETGEKFISGMKLCVTLRPGRADVFFEYGGAIKRIKTLESAVLKDCDRTEFCKNAKIGLRFAEGEVTVSGAEIFDDSGISQADIRAVTTESGEVFTDGGKVYFTASLRLCEGCMQGILSWIPGTAEFELCGTLFFDCDDGIIGNDVASALVFDRRKNRFLLWYCSFSHGHILGFTEFTADVRFGRNVIDTSLVAPLPREALYEFGGIEGDEDPALIYDENRQKWLLAVCRVEPSKGYFYCFFESDEPLSGFRYTGRSVGGGETGGSFLRYDGRLLFVCGGPGNSEYRVYDYENLSGFSLLRHDFPDGGFRGWGTVFTLNAGTRRRIFHLTFDRTLGSEYNWSYGNVCLFEADG